MARALPNAMALLKNGSLIGCSDDPCVKKKKMKKKASRAVRAVLSPRVYVAAEGGGRDGCQPNAAAVTPPGGRIMERER